MTPTVTGLLILSISILIFFAALHLYNLRKGNKVKALWQKVGMIISREKIRLAKKDIINNQFIGLDRSNKILVLSYNGNNDTEVDAISLANVTYCKLDKQTTEEIHRGRNRTVSEKLLSRISLLLFSAKKKLLAEFVFFDEEKNRLSELPRLTKKAEYWRTLIKKAGITEVD